MNYWLNDWKMERSTSKCNCHPRLRFSKKAWTTLPIIYDRSHVCNLFFYRSTAVRRLHTAGDSLEMWALAKMKRHPLQTSWENESSYMRVSQACTCTVCLLSSLVKYSECRNEVWSDTPKIKFVWSFQPAGFKPIKTLFFPSAFALSI